MRITYLKFIVIGLTIYLVLSGCGSSSVTLNTDSIKKEADIDKIINDTIATERLPGVIVYINSPSFSMLRVKGKSDIANNIDLKEDDLFRIASITKTFTATVILQLAASGKLSLDDKLSKYFPDFPNADQYTLTQLLNHSSNIVDYTHMPVFSDVYYNLQAVTTKKWTDSELLALIKDVSSEPSDGFEHYSNTNYLMLGMIIEKVTGHKLGYEITERIIKPLKLENTVYPELNVIRGSYAHGYVSSPNITVRDANSQFIDFTMADPSLASGAGAMISNLHDLSIWTVALAKGSLLSAEMHQKQLTFIPTYGGGAFGFYGLGVMKAGNLIGHSGSYIGYKHNIFYLPQKSAVIIVLTNLESNAADSLMLKVAKLAFPNDCGYW